MKEWKEWWNGMEWNGMAKLNGMEGRRREGTGCRDECCMSCSVIHRVEAPECRAAHIKVYVPDCIAAAALVWHICLPNRRGNTFITLAVGFSVVPFSCFYFVRKMSK